MHRTKLSPGGWGSRSLPLILFSWLLCSRVIMASEAYALDEGLVTDVDGNAYRTVVIGEQEWMAENLKTTRFSDGTGIPRVVESVAWSSIIRPAYCWYEDGGSNSETHGALYNWYAVSTGKLCPRGWHVPTDEEWNHLEGFVDTQSGVGASAWNRAGLRGYDAGRQLKASWGWSSGGDGLDSFGFGALPGGERLRRDGSYITLGKNGFWWTSTEDGASAAWFRSMIYAFDRVARDSHNKGFGFSVRCLRER